MTSTQLFTINAADSPHSSSRRRTSAILVLVLALSSPDDSRAPLSSAKATSRGVLADRDRQSEARQYLIHAALKRAEELNRLRDLPDTPAGSEEAPPKVAGLPSDRTDADPEETATTPETPVVTIPIEIGEPHRSSCRPSCRRRCCNRCRKRIRRSEEHTSEL